MPKKLQEQINKIKKSIIDKNIPNDSVATFGKLKYIEHSLYRYNQLSNAGLKDDAKTEKFKVANLIDNFNATEEETVLKGGISNVKYVWRSSPDSCEECQALDGTEYDFAEDIPDKPHPNCNCEIETVTDEDDEDDDDDDNDEPCDCVERLEELIAELEENGSDLESIEEESQADAEDLENMASHVENMIAEMNETLESLSEDYGQHLADCENNIDAIYDEIVIKIQELQNLLTDILTFLDNVKSYLQVLAIFVGNYFALLYEAYVLREKMDKYRHSVANCQSAQLGEYEEEVAKMLSDKKEIYDQHTYMQTHHVTLEKAVEDSERDQVANRLGRERGRNNPNCDCRILMQDLKHK